ncbi:hypothetical protein [Nocardia aobensis]|nr:hypothetical protein [Nocardia aobensis]
MDAPQERGDGVVWLLSSTLGCEASDQKVDQGEDFRVAAYGPIMSSPTA